MIRKFGKWLPKISENAIIDESAIIIGNVFVNDFVSIWPGVIIRAGEIKATIEKNACILDKAFIEAHEEVLIGENSIISHGAIIHGSKIKENVLVGIGAIILEVEIGKNSIIAAGSVVKENVKENSFMAGVPARKIREVSKKEIEEIRKIGEELHEKAKWLIQNS